MQFRERRRVIQVIRTIYDPKLKRGRSEVVGKIDKADPAITDKLHKACTPEEIEEIAAWLYTRGESLKTADVRGSAITLAERMRQAAEYFASHRDHEAEAEACADAIWLAWDELKKAMRQAGLAKPHGKSRAAPRGAASSGEDRDDESADPVAAGNRH